MKTIKEVIFFSALFFSLISCNYLIDTKKQTSMTEFNSDELKYRPSFHFSPKKNWMNDPNGMFFYKGVYHLYYQHNPDASVWGPMHWGHATSLDLKHWEEQPIALFPDDLGTIFSGSAVVDHNNTSGLGQEGNPAIIAIYTNHDSEKASIGKEINFQTQSIAYSLDSGQTWTKYTANPVLKNPGIIDFRDPKVFWYESDQKWVMTLAAGQEIQFYESKNLLSWTYLSSFGEGVGNHKGVWECPDLFPLPLKGTETTKWVQLLSINPGGPNGGSATQYFVGEFDGTNFIIDPDFKSSMDKEHNFWLDFGRDNYAGVSFSNLSTEANGVVYLGWMSNWNYANEVPTTTWRSAMTLPRELELIHAEGDYRLRSIPPSNWDEYTTRKLAEESRYFEKQTTLVASGQINLLGAQIKLDLLDLKEGMYTFFLENKEGDVLTFGYNHETYQFFIDRSKTGKTNFSEKFSTKPSVAPRTKKGSSLAITIILDKASIELFFDEGETVMTEIFFTKAPFETFRLETSSGKATLGNLEIKELMKK